MPFLSVVTSTFDLDIQTHPSEGPTRLLCEFGANPFSGSHDISYTNQKVTGQRQKQNLTQFTACGNNGHRIGVTVLLTTFDKYNERTAPDWLSDRLSYRSPTVDAVRLM